LPAKTHGAYSYPEKYVCVYRLGKNKQVDEVARALILVLKLLQKNLQMIINI